MIFCALLKSWTLVLVFVGIGERVHLHKVIAQSESIVVGATRQSVLHAIGEPQFKWNARRGVARLIFGRRPALWIYGTTTNLKALIIPDLPFPNPIPIKIRLFSADQDDLVIDWTSENLVAAINRPPIDVPTELRKLYEPVYFVADFARMLAAKSTD